MQTPWQIDMFGGLCAQQGDCIITRFATAKTAALLAHLALFPRRSHAREELADLLWPDADLEAGRTSLRQALSSLRRQMEPPGTLPGSVLIADRLSVRLNPGAIRTDVAAFEAALKDAARAVDISDRRRHLERAADLYKGELLPGYYDDGVLSERERLTAVYEEVQQQLAEIGHVAIANVRLTPPDAAPPLNSEPPVGSSSPMLPVQFTRFFGREREREQIEALLQDTQVRLITLTGIGGAGKTRLAVETARHAAGAVFFVPLADLFDATLIPDAVAAALRVPRSEGQDALELAVATLSAYPHPLLILDNMEQIAEGGAVVISRLLTRVPSLTCLVTSRQRLELAGEREVPLSPLPLPSETDTPEALAAVPSAQLFLDRAQASRPDFQVTPRNARTIAALCRRLEGLPLALELAAAWSLVLTPSQMLEHLDRQFEFLVSRRKDMPTHRRTLWATIGWSYDLLPPGLQRFWSSLAVFRGGWTAEAAQSVCAEANALHALTQLRARSLILLDGGEAEMRFRMPEMLREFAWGQMTETEQVAISRRHAEHFCALAEAAKRHLKGPEQAAWLERLESEHDNFRATLDRLHPDPDGVTGEVRLAGALYDFWYLRGHIREARARYLALLARPGTENTPPRLFGIVLNAAGMMAAWQDDLDEAQTLLERNLALQSADDHDNGVAVSLANLGLIARRRGDYAAAITWAEQVLALRRRQGDDHGVAISLISVGVAQSSRGKLMEAEAALTESLKMARTLGDEALTGKVFTNLGVVYETQGHPKKAHACWSESLRLSQTSGNISNLVAPLLNLAGLYQHSQCWERTARLRGAVAALSEKQGLSLTAQDRALRDKEAAELKAQMGDTAFACAWAEGADMTLDEVVTEALGEAEAASP